MNITKTNRRIGGESLKLFGANISHTTVFFRTEDEQFEMIFERDIFGNVKKAELCRNKRGEPPINPKKVEVTTVTPKNKFYRLKMIFDFTIGTITYYLKSKFRHQ